MRRHTLGKVPWAADSAAQPEAPRDGLVETNSSAPPARSDVHDRSRTDGLDDLLLGVIITALGLAQFGLTSVVTTTTGTAGVATGAQWCLAGALAALVGSSAALWRRAPAAGLAVLTVLVPLQVLGQVPVFLAQASAALVAFGAARWARPWVVAAGAVFLAADVAVVAVVALFEPRLVAQVAHVIPRDPIAAATEAIDRTSVFAGALVTSLLVLLAPWGAGLLVRWRARALASQCDAERALRAQLLAQGEAAAARAAAAVRSEQAHLAREVHDVVGHSLVVVLAQAESVRFLAEEDVEGARRAAAAVADTARRSLQEIRGVLAATRPIATAGLGTLDEIPTISENSPGWVEESSVRLQAAAAVDEELAELVARVAETVPLTQCVEGLSPGSGAGLALEPVIAQAAYRVLQELLTNALKHGRRGGEVSVVRRWTSPTLHLEVVNAVDDVPLVSPSGHGHIPGQGLSGLKERVEDLGGTVDVDAGPAMESESVASSASDAEGKGALATSAQSDVRSTLCIEPWLAAASEDGRQPFVVRVHLPLTVTSRSDGPSTGSTAPER